MKLLLLLLSVLPAIASASNLRPEQLQRACGANALRAVSHQLAQSAENRPVLADPNFLIAFQGAMASEPGMPADQDLVVYRTFPAYLDFALTVKASCGFVSCSCEVLRAEQI